MNDLFLALVVILAWLASVSALLYTIWFVVKIVHDFQDYLHEISQQQRPRG